MAKITLNINRSDISKADVDQLQNYFNGLPENRQRILIENYSSFASWLKDKSPRLYNNVYPYLKEVWSQIQDILEDVLEGLVIVAAAPVIIAVEGIKAIGEWLDDL